jgi:glycosyltransferase involved in cell wall biosynthesis
MKILVLTNKLPYPPFDGGSIATLNMLTGLRDVGNELVCLAMNTSKHPFPISDIPEEFSGTIQFRGVYCNSAIRRIPLLLNLLFSSKPYIAERFNLKAYRASLIQLLESEDFDLIQLEGPYLGHYINSIREKSKAKISLRAHNVEHLIWRRKAKNESSFLKRRYLSNMAARLKKFEMEVTRHVDCLVSISPVDELYFKKKGFSGNSIAIPTAISLDQYQLTPLPGSPTLFFIGALDWLPNQEGLLWFIEHVLELIVREHPEVEFHIAGRNAPESFRERLNHPAIRYHGEVEDAKIFMSAYRVMVAPLLTGSGIRIKILEGMALGRPVVTTSIGMEGIMAENDKELLIGDEPEIFKDQILRFLTVESEARRISEAARQLIKEKFDTFGLSSQLSKFFNKYA